ncbi:hypothetical protein [Nonomuraea pusilla]|uniref:Uncharacterized protein n=1 Tax=Nonomuraea pusilla TaxID=46177 RepID=A0A1H7QNF6_9ACTN|nr:hypothetical protein [Nonomuraea pusilla]SEL49462.1 hypothetical protein SAMN05660976_02621 [Nonomuraea pusilla]
MTRAQRFGAGLVLAALGCGVSSLLATTAEARVTVVALVILAYGACVMDVAAAVCAGVTAWALAVAFLLGVERVTDAPAALAMLVAAAVAGTFYGRWRAGR